MYEKIKCHNYHLKFPSYSKKLICDSGIEFLEKLLEKDPKKRINSLKKIKETNYYKNFDWEKLYKRELKPKFKPKEDESIENPRYFSDIFTKEKINKYSFIISEYNENDYDNFTDFKNYRRSQSKQFNI